MKRFFPFLLLLFLTSCALAPDEYRSVAVHAGSAAQTEITDAVTVGNSVELKQAILDFVEAGITDGTIHTANYDGDVEQDLADAAYEASKLEPLGAYAVDYMTHDCTLIVNYYEIKIHITFRRTAREIAGIVPVSSRSVLTSMVEDAVQGLDSSLTMLVSNYWEPDIAEMVQTYCADHPDTMLEQPKVSTAVYPDKGSTRIVEVSFQYINKPDVLRTMAAEVREAVHNAAEYIRYRQTAVEKLELLFTYLTERFPYEAGTTVTPLYDALCTGIADPAGLASAWQLICDEAGVECYTVEGLYYGEARQWNVVGVDGGYRHLDLARCMVEDGKLRLWTDLEMTGYYWKQEQVPACILVAEPEEVPPAEEEQPEEEPPEEEQPPETEPGEEPPEEDAPPQENPAQPPEEAP